MNLNQIFYINENKFVCQLVERICKQNDIKCYTINEILDFTYLIEDLKPQLIIVAQDTMNIEGEFIRRIVNSSILKPKVVEIQQLNPKTFIDDLQNFL